MRQPKPLLLPLAPHQMGIKNARKHTSRGTRRPICTRFDHYVFSIHDSGCSSMAIPESDLGLLLRPGEAERLSYTGTETASGSMAARRLRVSVRVMLWDGAKQLTRWGSMRCMVYESINSRIFRGYLENKYFIGNQSHRQQLYVTHTRDQLALMPKTWSL